MHTSKSILANETHKILWDCYIQKTHLIPARRPDLMIVNKKKKRTCRIVDFAVPADHSVKPKKLWNMKVTAIPIVIGAHGTVIKRSVKRLEDF